MKIIDIIDDIVSLCRNQIGRDIGTLKDLPPKLRNSIASFYYHFFLFAGKTLASDETPLEIFTSSNPRKSLFTWTKDVAWWIAASEAIPDYVKGLRQIDSIKQPNLYNYTVDFINDMICYDMGKIAFLPPILRKSLLLFKKKKFKNIPGLDEIIIRVAQQITPVDADTAPPS